MPPSVLEYHGSITDKLPVIHDDWQDEPTAKLLRVPRKSAEVPSYGVQLERMRTIQDPVYSVFSWFPLVVFLVVFLGYSTLSWVALAQIFLPLLKSGH